MADIEEVVRSYFLDQRKPELGDRTSYVGSSDLGCARKAVLQKMRPLVAHSLRTHMRFKRGDIVEEMVGRALAAAFNPPPLTQLEVTHPEHPEYKAHIDFTFEGARSIGVLECKSTERDRSDPYDSWIHQVQWQMGLLALRYPQHTVRGAIICVDISGTVKVFKDQWWSTPNERSFSLLMEKAALIWQCLQERTPDAAPTETGPLCAYCGYRMDCPALRIEAEDGIAVDLTPISERLESYAAQTTAAKEASDMAATERRSILDYIGESTLGRLGDRIIRFPEITQTRVDSRKLSTKYPDVFRDVTKQITYRTIKMM